jgi:antitoxin component YwqK of YwqJK toxin-antitoxin module|tara:strand:- start:214 stop:453 length:240 start_codon:yes stop_codon:yes gene_type:complete
MDCLVYLRKLFVLKQIFKKGMVLFIYPIIKNYLQVKNLCKYENGKKGLDGNYKDGKHDGKWTYWYENGQKKERLVLWSK